MCSLLCAIHFAFMGLLHNQLPIADVMVTVTLSTESADTRFRHDYFDRSIVGFLVIPSTMQMTCLQTYSPSEILLYNLGPIWINLSI